MQYNTATSPNESNPTGIMATGVEKDRGNGLRHSTHKTVTARGSLECPRVRHVQAKVA
jgi:hypothetical protein